MSVLVSYMSRVCDTFQDECIEYVVTGCSGGPLGRIISLAHSTLQPRDDPFVRYTFGACAYSR